MMPCFFFPLLSSLFSLLLSLFLFQARPLSILNVCVFGEAEEGSSGGGSVNDMSTEPGDTFVRQPHDVRRNCLSILFLCEWFSVLGS